MLGKILKFFSKLNSWYWNNKLQIKMLIENENYLKNNLKLKELALRLNKLLNYKLV